jgi:RimJ/RimL family protein N-acetyltransferase
VKLPDEMLTDRLRLRPPTNADAERIFTRYGQDAEVCRYMSWVPHRTVEDAHAFLKRIKDEKRVVRLVFCRVSGELFGSVGGQPQGHRVEFGYCLARNVWGRGYATEAARAYVAAVLEDSSIWRIQAFCDLKNRASARVLEKAGLTLEGTLRRYMVMPNLGNVPRDMLCYAKIREDSH